MFIQLSENKAIKSDSYQFMLCKKVLKKDKDTGESSEVWSPYRYYPSLQKAMLAIPNQELKESDASSLQECVDLMNEWKQLIQDKIPN